MKSFKTLLNSNHAKGKLVLTLFVLLSSFVPVCAQLDQQWKQQQLDNSGCWTNNQRAQYVSKRGVSYYCFEPKYSKIVHNTSHGAFYIDNSKVIWNTVIVGTECRHSKIGRINEEIKRGKHSILFKVVGDKIIQYSKGARWENGITRIVIGKKLNRVYPFQ